MHRYADRSIRKKKTQLKKKKKTRRLAIHKTSHHRPHDFPYSFASSYNLDLTFSQSPNVSRPEPPSNISLSTIREFIWELLISITRCGARMYGAAGGWG